MAGARRLAAIDAAELVVADVSDADATVGAEVSYALFRRRCLTLCLCRRGSPGSAFMHGLAGHPLLTTFEYEDATQAEAEAVAFATPPESPGRIFVIEGGDGAGKQTQSRMLLERLRAEGYPCSTLDYPHDTALHGKLIRTLLSGAKGDIKSVNPLLFASLYAQNRADTAPLLRAWLKRGYNVVLDRYVEANFGHQASKLPSDERPALIAQLAAFEHDWLDLPRAHRVVYLDLPPEEALKAIKADGRYLSLVTYADEAQNHDGGVYKAANWEYVGMTGPYTRWLDPETGQQMATIRRNTTKMHSLGAVKAGRFHKHKFVLHLQPNRLTISPAPVHPALVSSTC